MREDFEAFLTAYLEAMFWAETVIDEDGNELGAFEDSYDPDDLDPASYADIVSDCASFFGANHEDIGPHTRQAGHDFYLTRNGHGCGFWDGDWSHDIGQRLTEASKPYGTQGLMVGDEGTVFTHG